MKRTGMITMNELTIDRIRLFALRAAPDRGPLSSLGPMPTRNGLLVEVTTKEGATGWGEVWCNIPPRGNISRMNLLADVMCPEVVGKPFPGFSDIRVHLEARLQRLAVHSGEPGAFWQCVSGLDTAAADASARMAGAPLCTFLGADSPEPVRVYASTPDLSRLDRSVHALVEAGHTAFKLKIGFGASQDRRTLERFREIAPNGSTLMVDANQGWSSVEAQGRIREIEGFGISFVEEPLLVTAPLREWAALAAGSKPAIAAGENFSSRKTFSDFLERGGLNVVQPDVAKWGGVSGAMQVARLAEDAGAACALHYMGTALGLAASAHVMAAMGGVGPVELDSNPNPLRTELGDIDLRVRAGRLAVPGGHGIGFAPDPEALDRLCVARFETK